MTTKHESARGSQHAIAISWILASFGLLAIGVIAGALLAAKGWSWAFPTAGFVGYVLAFRRGLLVWNSQGFDLRWRAPASGWSVRPRASSPKQWWSERGTARLVRGVFPEGAAGPSPDASRHRP